MAAPERFELTPGYTIARIENGTWQLSSGHTIHGRVDLADVNLAFHELVARGFTTFDTGDIYNGSEQVIGDFVRELKAGRGAVGADDIQIHTKYVPDIDTLAQTDFHAVEQIVDRSLRRLDRDVLDMVQFHWWDYDVPGCVDVAGYLTDLRAKGKIRNVSVTNFDTDHLAELVEAGIPVVSMQAQYSVFDRRVERRMRDYCLAHGVAQLLHAVRPALLDDAVDDIAAVADLAVACAGLALDLAACQVDKGRGDRGGADIDGHAQARLVHAPREA